VKNAVMRRKGTLRLIVTSATLDTDQFAKYFNDCPVLKVEGRCYPVEILHGNCSANKRIEEAVRAAIRMHMHEGPGDILIFLPGSEDCEIACKMCITKLQELVARQKEVPSMVIYPLYGAQACEDQTRVFERPPEHHRKLIFSTNIAETSLTIDGIGFVIDCGYVKQKCYNPRTGMVYFAYFKFNVNLLL
jgi:ATP-dependent RNA helicase DHX8/PRP22